MESQMAPASPMLDEKMMELILLALLFLVVRDHRVVDLVNNTLLSVMPDLQLEDENGEPTLIQNAVHAVIFAGLWFVLDQLNLRTYN